MNSFSIIKILLGKPGGLRYDKVILDIIENKKRYKQVKYTGIVFGERNGIFLKSQGIPFLLVSKDNYVDYEKSLANMFIHKLLGYRFAMEQLGPFLAIDWDMRLVGDISCDFGDWFLEKDSFQSNLIQYKNIKIPHRLIGRRQIPTGSFVYCREIPPIEWMLENWKKFLNSRLTEEIMFGRYCENIIGRWDVDEYWKRFEPITLNIAIESSVFKNLKYKKPTVFVHCNRW